MKLYDLILASASRGIAMQREDGSMPPGHNGPWNHADTPTRTTAHWALIFLKAFLINRDRKFKQAALNSCEYLLSEKALVNGYFFCRKAPGKYMTNNLVGQAWAAEALAIVGTYLENQRFISFVGHVLRKHFFNSHLYLWHKETSTGNRPSLCRTLNQQMMFSTVALFAGKKIKDPKLIEQARSFFAHFFTFSRFIEPGLPHHKVFLPLDFARFNSLYFKTLMKQWVEKYFWKKISVDYLPFILYTTALNHFLNPDETFWKSVKFKNWFKQVMDYVVTHFPYGYLESSTSFRWSYNPVGFEVYFALNEFHQLLELEVDLEAEKRWVEMQIKGYYDLDSKLMSKNSCDPYVLMSRLYEAIWLPDLQLRIEP